VVQETDTIKDHIDTERAKLERDLHEIEHRVTKAVDWREWFDRNPAGMLGAAAAGGFVLSLLLRRSSDTAQDGRYAGLDSSTSATGVRKLKSPSTTSSQMDRMVETFDNTLAALLGVASRKVRDFVSDMVPNFREEYSELEAKRFR
jgi:heme A synthase